MRSTLLFVLLLVATMPAFAADDIRQFDFGDYHRCSLDAAGAVDCLGESNRYGQIGGDVGENGTPHPVRVIRRGARKLALGGFYSCALVGDALQCWGDLPQRGNGAHAPVVLIGHGVSDVAAGEDRICAIVAGAVQCIGAGGRTGSDAYQNAHPVADTVIERGASAVAVGRRYACAVVDGALWCWGEVPSYSWGADHFVHPLPPTRVIERDVSAVATGDAHACAIVDHALRCWGDNSQGQVGLGIPAMPAPAAPPASPAANVVEGEQHCERHRDLSILCRVEHPAEVIADGVDTVVAKKDATCAIVRGALSCWGRNANGQLGIASHGTDVTRPTEAIPHGVSRVATGARTCALVDGALQCSRPCTTVPDVKCPPEAGFAARDLAFGLSPLEARVGVWRGTIGTHAVMACLQRDGSDATYYYVEHGASIGLSPVAGSEGASWTEGGDEGVAAATWTLDPANGDTLAGRWSDASGRRTLPIRLARVAAPGDPGSACGSYLSTPASRAFNAPRVDAQAIAIAPWNEHSRKVSVLGDAIGAIELLDGTPGAQAFNAAVREWLREKIVGYYDCRFHAPQGEFGGSLEVEWQADPWIVVRELYSSDCGGTYSSGGVADFWVWNLAEGRRVDPWQWIVTARSDDGCPIACERQPTDALNDLVIASATRNKDGDECTDSVNEYRQYGLYQLHAGPGGLVFSTDFPRAAQACNEDIEIPWAKLAPFLTAQGRKAMQSIRRAAGAKR